MTMQPIKPVQLKLKMYVDAHDYKSEGAITSMIQMKTRLETLEEATKRENWEQEWAKKHPVKHYKYYIDATDYHKEGVITNLIQMKTRLETEEETQIRYQKERF
jgi:hypothetical protein